MVHNLNIQPMLKKEHVIYLCINTRNRVECIQLQRTLNLNVKAKTKPVIDRAQCHISINVVRFYGSNQSSSVTKPNQAS